MRTHHFVIALSIVLIGHALAILGMTLIGNAPKPPVAPPVIQATLITIPPITEIEPEKPVPPKPVEPKKKPEPVKKDKPVVQKPDPVLIPEKVIAVDTPVTETTNTLTVEPPPPAPEPVAEPVVTPPRVDAKNRDNPPPDYPRLARRMGQQGTVVLEVFILANGKVGEIRLKNSSGFPRLDEAAIAAVKHWRYMPARRGDAAIDYWYTQPVKFVLN